MVSSAEYWAYRRFSKVSARVLTLACSALLLLSVRSSESVLVFRVPSKDSSLSVKFLKFTAIPPPWPRASALLANRPLRPSRLVKALSSLVVSVLSFPPSCIWMPISAKRVSPPVLPEMPWVSMRKEFCKLTVALSPCSTPAVLLSSTYLVDWVSRSLSSL